MNGSEKQHHGTFSLRLQGTFISSALATLTIIFVTFVSNHNTLLDMTSTIFVPAIYATLFGWIYKDWGITMYVPLTSWVSICLVTQAFPPFDWTLDEIPWLGLFSLNWLPSSYVVTLGILIFIKRKLSLKFLMVLPLFGLSYVVYVFSSDIVALLDQRPWIVTILVGILTLVGGIVIGRWQSKK